MGTVCPSPTLISFRTPADGEGISASTLSVEISNNGSSRSTLSPGFFSHLVIVPSKMLSPIWGITISTAMIVLLFSLSLNIATVALRQQKLFSHSEESILPMSVRMARAYGVRLRARAARRDHRKPFRKVWRRPRRRFRRSWCLHARPGIYWSFSPIAEWSLHPAAAASVDRSLRPQYLPSPMLPPLPAKYASSPRRKGWSGVSLRGAPPLCRSAQCNPRRELLP